MKLLIVMFLVVSCSGIKYNAGYLRHIEENTDKTQKPAAPYHLQIKKTIEGCVHELINKDVQATTAFEVCDGTYRPARSH